MAARIASSARTEQWIFTGGKESSFTMSVFLIASASSTVRPLIHSVASEELAIAEQAAQMSAKLLPTLKREQAELQERDFH